MNIINSLSVPFYEFRCEDNLVTDVLSKVEKLEFKSAEESPYGVQPSKDLFYHRELINWFDECVNKVKKLYFDDNFKFEITNCWATKTNFISKHHSHRHHQSIIAGIFYLQDSDVGETIFTLENPWHECSNFFSIPETLISQNKIVEKVKQEKGKLILYPGHLDHGTTLNKDRKPRYVVAFDSFFSCKHKENAEWPYFEIKTTNVHEAYSKLNKSNKIGDTDVR